MGDIKLEGVQDPDGFAKAIKNTSAIFYSSAIIKTIDVNAP